MELKELKGLTGHMSHISSIGFSCDGMHIVSGSFGESMHVCDVSKGRSWRATPEWSIQLCFQEMEKILCLAQMTSL